jgi:hypothetical protein
MGTFFTIWSFIWLVSFVLMLLRRDGAIMFKDIFGTFLTPSVFTILLTALFVFTFLPLTAPESIRLIIKDLGK